MTSGEVSAFANDCNSKMLPDSTKALTNITVTRFDNTVEIKNVSKSIFCSANNSASSLWDAFYFTAILDFDVAYRTCQKLNAELVFPGNELELSTLFSVLNFSQFSGDCLDRIWVPVVRSKLNASTWVYVVVNSDVAAELGAWTMADDTDIQGDLNCLHFRLFQNSTFVPFFFHRDSNPQSQSCDRVSQPLQH